MNTLRALLESGTITTRIGVLTESSSSYYPYFHGNEYVKLVACDRLLECLCGGWGVHGGKAAVQMCQGYLLLTFNLL